MSKTISAPNLFKPISYFCAMLLIALSVAASASAQSTNLDRPTPVTSNEVSGQIVARDIGDSRLTRYFYILTGTPGDLVVTVESRNLDGDVDLFQAGTLRPLAKVSMYAGEQATSTSKSIYLRSRETLILRVEARTPNDNEGTFRISFSGGFEAMAAPLEPETDATATTQTPPARRGNTRRVNAVGARINEPEPVETARTETDAAATETPSTDNSTKPAENSEATTTPTAPATTTTARTQRPPSVRTGRRRRGGRTTPPTPPVQTARNDSAASEATEEAPPAMVRKPSGIEAGAKLVLEMRDGVRVERFMNTVRRVTVENGQIVVIGRDGKVTRHPMTEVTRMAIEP